MSAQSVSNIRGEVAEWFARDVADHQMTVLHEDGTYRHLRFKRPDTGTYWFDLITWPGCLAINGDMQSFLFARLTDMFEFFRADSINPTYWSEKLRASSGVRRYSEDVFRDRVNEEVAEHAKDWPGLARAVEEQIFIDQEGISDEEQKRFERTIEQIERYADDRLGHGGPVEVPRGRP